MTGLAARLSAELSGRVCVMGLGNEQLGDDAFGMKLARLLQAGGCLDVLLAGTTPEQCVNSESLASYDHLVFLDATNFGGAPGAVVWLSSAEIESRFPQISTHKLSMGLLARLVEHGRQTKAWLLGAQPASLEFGAELSPPLQTTLAILAELLGSILLPRHLQPAMVIP